MFPNRLLSSHFWSESQKRQFEQKTLNERYENLIKLRIYLMDKTNELNKYLLDHLVKIENKVCKNVKAVMIKISSVSITIFRLGLENSGTSIGSGPK